MQLGASEKAKIEAKPAQEGPGSGSWSCWFLCFLVGSPTPLPSPHACSLEQTALEGKKHSIKCPRARRTSNSFSLVLCHQIIHDNDCGREEKEPPGSSGEAPLTAQCSLLGPVPVGSSPSGPTSPTRVITELEEAIP